ncbi:carbohydrate kinase family protein [Planctomicrobium sp. SH668]|uniref:carbohydrate kinase family protein n=1 Tax=Planctomicrobium sp. SH668 TaxID=3448126 RepID=UPI003F5AE0E3
MTGKPCEIVVAGHVCLDVIPTFEHRDGGDAPSFRPGHLIHVGHAVRATGGAVSNTGLALHRLGTPVRLLGKVGDDLFGEEIIRLLNTQGSGLADGMVCVPGEVTSYSIVINPPGVDRTFLHCPGANDTFQASDVRLDAIEGARLFHVGYPPLMRTIHENNGRELRSLFEKVKQAGLTTSLDLCMVDPNTAPGKMDWEGILKGVLPFVDIFCPSIDELLFMLDRPTYDAAERSGGFDPARHVTREIVESLSTRCLEMGAAITALKLGHQGLFIRTSPNRDRLEQMGKSRPLNIDDYVGRSLYSPCFQANVVGTTGSGDCTIAGLLAAFVRGETLENVLQSAVAVGAASVEAADATSGVRPWSELVERINAGWQQSPGIADLIAVTAVSTQPE